MAKSAKSSWAFYGGWILLSVTGYALPPIIGDFLLANPLGALDRHPIWSAVAAFGLFGGTIGLTQWVALRRYVRYAAWWIPLTAAGWATAGLIGGRTFGSLADMVPAALLPPVVGCFGVWLLLEGLTGRGEPASYPSERRSLGQP